MIKNWTRQLIQDIRYAFRMLAKNLSFTAIAVLTLALGITANTTIFSWISATLLDPVPGASRTNELVSVMKGERKSNPFPPFCYPDYADLRERSTSFSGILAHHDEFAALTDKSNPERVYISLVSANYFDVLDVKPFLGSIFPPEEEIKRGVTPSVIISYGLWQRRYGSDQSIVGKPIQVNKTLCTIAGVAPSGFRGCKSGLREDLWAPLVYRGEQLNIRGSQWLNVMGRLKPGVDRQQAETELGLQMKRIAEQYPESHQNSNQITLDPLWCSPFGANTYFCKILPMLLALAGVLLMLACANVANLVLVRSVARRREIAIRLSLGAGRFRLIRGLFLEYLLLALFGGAFAMLFTFWTSGTMASFVPSSTLPLAINEGDEQAVIVLASFVVSLVTSVIFGIIPALRSSRLAPVEIMKEESGSASTNLHKSRLAGTLVAAQISLSLLLLIVAGLFVRSLQKAEQQDAGFDPDKVLLVSYDIDSNGYSTNEGHVFNRQVLTRLETLPGIESVSIADFSPLSFSIHSEFFQVDEYESQPHESMEINCALVGPDYFRTVRTDLVSGREFSFQDTERSRLVAIVNEAFVNRYWPGHDPIGKKIKRWGRWVTVIGVARNAKYRRLVDPPEPCVYIPIFQTGNGNDWIIHARVAGDPHSYRSSVVKTVHELDPELPVFGITTLRSSMQLGSLFERIAGTFAGAFGLLSLLLASVGIYGVVAYTTQQRTREIGIRMAMGSTQGDIFRLVLKQGLRLAVSGLAIGLLLSTVLTHFLRGMLYGVSNMDIPTIAVVSIILCAVTMVACLLPARRAARVDPNTALRYE